MEENMKTRLFRDLTETERKYFLRKRRTYKAQAKRKGAVRFQDSFHGAGLYSLQAFDASGELVLDRQYAY